MFSFTFSRRSAFDSTVVLFVPEKNNMALETCLWMEVCAACSRLTFYSIFMSLMASCFFFTEMEENQMELFAHGFIFKGDYPVSEGSFKTE